MDKSEIPETEDKVEINTGEKKADKGGTFNVAENIYVGLSLEQTKILLEKLRREFQPKPFSGKCPYPGLDAFRETDTDLFFGLENQIAALLKRIKTASFLMIAGPSGSGKSFLVRGGVGEA
jgi:hypothetical protein